MQVTRSIQPDPEPVGALREEPLVEPEPDLEPVGALREEPLVEH
jgi:hypothetical protein